jgi:hydrophobe/amphiphile efflux-3 (HAE3) family protein
MKQFWINTDIAPDEGVMSGNYFIKPSFLSDIKNNVANFLSSEYTIENDAKLSLIILNINGSINYSALGKTSREIVSSLNEADDIDNAIRFKATGNSIIEYEINDVSMDANSIVIPLIFVVISIILFINFRKPSYVFLPLLGLTFAIIWLFGTMVIFGLPFMIMEVALIPMLMGLGVDYSVHLYHNYRVERGKGLSPKEAMRGSIRDIGIAMLLATITTFIAFISFLTATMIPLRDFGVLCAIGIAYVFVITLTFQAAMRYLIDSRKNKKKSKKKTAQKKEYGKSMRRIARFICKHPVPILIFTCIISVFMIFGMIQIGTGFAMEDFLPEENPSVQVLNTLIDEFPFASQEKEYVLIEGEGIATVSTLKSISKTIDNFNDDDFVLRTREGTPKVESVLSIIEQAAYDNKSIVKKFSINYKGIPSSNENVISLFDYLYDHDSYSYEIKTFLSKDDNGKYDATVIHVYSDVYNADNDIKNSMELLYNGLLEDISGEFDDKDVTVTGDNSMMHVIMNSMTESQLFSTSICLVLAAIILIIAYRNPILGMITMVPVLISTLWIVGTMYFIGYSLNVMTIMITSLTIGLGITYAIHAVERFRLVAENTGDVIGAVSETIGHTGNALFISAMTTIFGFGLLILTPMPVEQQFGLITALTILYAFLTSIFVLPLVLLIWGRYRKKHKGYIISPGNPNEKKK